MSCNTDNKISDDISVYLYGGEIDEQSIAAEYVGGSLYYDIAVLRVEDSEVLKDSCAAAVSVANSDKTSVGEQVIAVGNPEDMGISVSYGIVSVDSENLTMTAADESTTVSFRVMRIDAAVNSGNSGGGLYNTNGELVGIVNAKIVDESVENIGYAIPSNVARAVADNIIDNCFEKENEFVLRAILGISVISSNSRAEYDSKSGLIHIVEDVEIYDIEDESLASTVLEVGDIIKSVRIGEKTLEVTRMFHISDTLLDVREEDSVEITVVRYGEEMSFNVTFTDDYIIEY